MNADIKGCNQLHDCKTCSDYRKLKLMMPCADCWHNEKFFPVSGTGMCHYKEKGIKEKKNEKM